MNTRTAGSYLQSDQLLAYDRDATAKFPTLECTKFSGTPGQLIEAVPQSHNLREFQLIIGMNRVDVCSRECNFINGSPSSRGTCEVVQFHKSLHPPGCIPGLERPRDVN